MKSMSSQTTQSDAKAGKASTMVNPCFLSRVALVVALLLGNVDFSRAEDHDHDHDHDHGDHETCACAAEEYTFTIDCSDTDAMLAALPLLQSNDCATDCSSDVCRRNYFIVQAHHDYCLEGDIPEPIEDGIHFYEGSCEGCEISRRPDPSLPDCPQASCDDDSGNLAYQQLLNLGCLGNNCSTTECGESYRTLRVVHDTCEEDVLDTQAEVGIHDFEEICGEQNCNVGDTVFSQLVCTHEEDAETSAASSPRSILILALVGASLLLG